MCVCFCDAYDLVDVPQTELLDAFTDGEFPEHLESSHAEDRKVVTIRAASFSWNNEGDAQCSSTAGRRFSLRIDEEIKFKPASINLVVGPTGSGRRPY